MTSAGYITEQEFSWATNELLKLLRSLHVTTFQKGKKLLILRDFYDYEGNLWSLRGLREHFSTFWHPISNVFKFVMPAGMFSIDSILAGRPSCKDSVLLHRNAPVVFSNLTESLYTAAGDFNGLYSHTAPPAPSLQSVTGTRIGYNNYYYGQLHVQGPTGPACCGAIPTLGSQQCPCIPTGNFSTFIHTFISCNIYCNAYFSIIV